MTYQFQINERELELILSALGIMSEIDAGNGHDDDAQESVKLITRLDNEATEQHDGDAQCRQGLHSWIDEVGKLPADTKCTRCGELYGDVK